VTDLKAWLFGPVWAFKSFSVKKATQRNQTGEELAFSQKKKKLALPQQQVGKYADACFELLAPSP
jgi:hypothetical protein